MNWETIIKSHRDRASLPNMQDYDFARATFSWEKALSDLEGLPGGHGINIGHEAVDRHVEGPLRDHPALRSIGRNGKIRDYTFIQLRGLTNHFANVLNELNIDRGDRVFALLGQIPEFYVVSLGALKHCAIFCPLPTSLETGSIVERMMIGEPKVLVTTESLYLSKIAPVRGNLTFLEHVILVADNHQAKRVAGTHDYHSLIYEASGKYIIRPTDPDEPALLHFKVDSGGKLRGIVHTHRSVMAHNMMGAVVLDLHDGDVYSCSAEPGWITGMVCGLIAPLANGVTTIVDECGFEIDRWYQTIEEQKISVWLATPAIIRQLKHRGTEATRKYDLGSLRFLASTGDRLDPESVIWGAETFGDPFHDTWEQTETGILAIANYAGMDVRPGSMGKPVPGITAAIVKRTDDDRIIVIAEPDCDGELALRPDFPSLFQTYWKDQSAFENRFIDGWYLTDDIACCDEDGYFWFTGRK